MPSLLAHPALSKCDTLSPAAVQARIADHARELANRDGSPAAVHAVADYREAYTRLWNLHQTMLEATTNPYFPERV